MGTLYGTVLIADDDTQAVEALKDALVRAGMRVVILDHLDDPCALSTTMDRHTPAVVVLDPLGFGGEGWKLLIGLRSDARYVPVPVVVLSAPLTATTRTMVFEQGAQQCAEKPLDDGEAVARVRSLIDHRREVASIFQTESRAVRRIPATCGTRRVPLVVDDVLYFASGQKEVHAYTTSESFLVDGSLLEYERLFGHGEFIRVHRSYLVRCSAMAGWCRGEDGIEVLVGQKDDSTVLPVSRRQAHAVRELLKR
jgi:DNA-binding LytR/AlgR family response regulator